MEEALIRVKDLCKIYNPGENEVRALDHINLEINKGEFVAIIGQSGSGKSTFMNMLGCLDVPTSGEYFLNGTDVSTMEDNELSETPDDTQYTDAGQLEEELEDDDFSEDEVLNDLG